MMRNPRLHFRIARMRRGDIDDLPARLRRLLRKPFRRAGLLQAVRESLSDQDARAGEDALMG